MLKRSLGVILALLCVFSFAGEALAAGTSDTEYTVSASAAEILYSGSVTFNITTPEQVCSIKAYNSGKQYAQVALTRSDVSAKVWAVCIVFKSIGKNNITFKAFSESGELLKQFPGDAVTITVNHLPPITQPPIILDSDRAVLMGAPPENCGIKQKEYGFCFGTDKDSLTKKLKSNAVTRGRINKLVTALLPDTTYYYRAYTVTSNGTVYGETISFATPPLNARAAQDAVFQNTPDRYIFLFGSKAKFYELKSPPFGFIGRAEASKQMVKIKVPVWKIRRGKKVSGTMPLTINYKLKSNVKAIFQEIYDLDIKFPVMALKGFSYRRIIGPGLRGSKIMSHHSFGAAIDINKPYNKFYLDGDKRNKKSPYYIPQPVIDIFAKYGWAWGGNFKEGMDTMHFQYLGLDLTKQK